MIFAPQVSSVEVLAPVFGTQRNRSNSQRGSNRVSLVPCSCSIRQHPLYTACVQ